MALSELPEQSVRMGYSLDLVEPHQESHSAEFTCAVCFQLVDAPLLTTCQHVFCMACLQDWFGTKPSCPTCSRELDPRHGAGELRLASPLAWRVLGRLRVRCSLPGCQWTGEYSEVGSHLTSSESHQVCSPSAPSSQANAQSANATHPAQPSNAAAAGGTSDAHAAAEALKVAGNSKFEQRIFADAIVLYTKAINLAPDVPAYLTNRAAAYFNSGRLADCVGDCRAAIKLDPTLAKAYKRLARALCEMGEYEKARAACSDGLKASGDQMLQEELDSTSELLCESFRQRAAHRFLPPSHPHPPSHSPASACTCAHAILCAHTGGMRALVFTVWSREGNAALENGDYSLARTFFANMLARTNAPTWAA